MRDIMMIGVAPFSMSISGTFYCSDVETTIRRLPLYFVKVTNCHETTSPILYSAAKNHTSTEQARATLAIEAPVGGL